MTGQKAIDLLMYRLGNRTNPNLRNVAILEMQLAQETVLELGPYIPWFCIEKANAVNILADTRDIILPDGFLREVDEKAVYVVDEEGNTRYLEKRDWDDLVEEWGEDATGELPSAYAIQGNKLYLFPIPTVERVAGLRITHYKKQPAPTDANEENNWLKYAPDLLIAAAGKQVCLMHLKDADRAVGFGLDMKDAYVRLDHFETARNEAGRSRRMG